MRASEIRSAFLRYFEERGHQVVPSASVVPEADPTLMFVNAGMVPFKRVFTGEEGRSYTRATSAQKCVRVSGKHNDLEEVGRSSRHQTFFEMLGNFSFGDYFKQDAIDYGWEFLTDVLGIDGDRLVVSVLDDDHEAYSLWRDRIGLEERRIFRLGPGENFWQMGDTGPCGSCSEIHLILDDEAFARGADPSGDGYVELWNLVFMEFEQTPDGERKPLPKPSVDTGMGLERMSCLLQGARTNYDIDLFAPLIERMAGIAGTRYGAGADSDVSLQVIADHARCCAVLIGDGVLPSNEGRGYVLRRVLRRAARHGVLLGVEEPFLYDVSGTAIDLLGDAYRDLETRRAFIQDTIRKEEERFGRTLGRGLALLDAEVAQALQQKRSQLDGDVVFKLYDTYGFPLDLTEDILRGRQLGFDRATFDARMREQSERARAAWKGSGQQAPDEVYGEIAARLQTEFNGYQRLEESASIECLLVDGQQTDEAGEGQDVEVFVRVTPFYAEGGGQVGDRGVIEVPGGRIEVQDTQRPVAGLVAHRGRVTLGRVRRGEQATLQVDADKRAATVRNHSATHLFHWALRRVLGEQVTQAGSLVAPDRLRFDFTHDDPLSAEQVRELEDLVNDLILRNVRAEIATTSYRQAIDDGAVAIFEEKYGDEVRVVNFGPSTELCGGTHAAATGEIGSFRIVGQSAIGAGVRRVEAQTGHGALAYARAQSGALQSAAQVLRTPPEEIAERVRRLLERQKELERELEKTRAQMRRGGAGDPMASVQERAGIKVLAHEVSDASPKELRGLVDELKQRMGSGVVLLVAPQQDKVALALGVTKDLTDRFRAGDLIKPVAECVGGSGGGRPDFAQAGGPRMDGVQQALETFRALIG